MNFSEPSSSTPPSIDEINSLQQWWELAGVDVHYEAQPRQLLAPPADTPDAREVIDSVTETVQNKSPLPEIDADYPEDLAAFGQYLANPGNLVESTWAREFARIESVANPKIMTISAIPEKDDQRQLSVFSTQNRTLAERMLAAIGCDSQQACFATIALARPVDGQLEQSFWKPLRQRIEHHVKLVQPERIICFGDLASRILFESDLLSARKKKLNINHVSSKTEVIVTFHPRILIERPELKAEAWKDLQRLTRIVAS